MWNQESETTPLVGDRSVPSARINYRKLDEKTEWANRRRWLLFPFVIFYSTLILLVGISIGYRKSWVDTQKAVFVSNDRMAVTTFPGQSNCHEQQHRENQHPRQPHQHQHPHQPHEKHPFLMYHKVPKDDFGPFKEYSVIHSDRSLNLMSEPFQQVMRNLNELLKTTYNATKVAIIPGSGTFGMEAVARQFASDKHVMVLRNGYFSYRWTQLFDFGRPSIPSSHTVLKAQPLHSNMTLHPQYVPYPLERVVTKIKKGRPAVLFAPHVETSTGIILPQEYIRQLSTSVHAVGGLLVLDCIASGTIWIDMVDLGVDVLISAPQKDWTSPPSSALVMLSERAIERIHRKQESSFSLSLKQWLVVMDAYEKGGFAYHTTPPTDALREFQRVSVEMLEFGLPQLKEALTDLGQEARNLLDSRGLTSVAAPGFEAPGVLVYYSPNDTDNLRMVQCFQEQGLQIAKGVKWMIDEPDNVKSFRIGLFGLDKLLKEQPTIDTLQVALDNVLADILKGGC